MSDSHKISLLDLQTPDLSQYGKKNLDQNRVASRSTESNYRKQLSESLSKKQSTPTADKKLESESRSIDFQSGKTRTENKQAENRTTAESQENRVQVEGQQSEIRRDEKSASDAESQVPTSASEKSAVVQEPESQNSSESVDSTEEDVLSQQELKQSIKGKEPTYSLFDSTFVGQAEGKIVQEATTEDGEILPPANFQFVEDQRPVDLPVQVTETSAGEAIPIPEGLAELLNQQLVDTSQTDSVKEVQAVDSSVENQELDSVLQKTAELTAPHEDEAVSIDREALLHSEEISELKLTEELKQAIQEYEKTNSDDAADATGENEVEIQSIIQQQSLHSRNEVKSTSPSAESDNEEAASDQASSQGKSDLVIEQVSQEWEPEQTDVAEKLSRDTAQGEQDAEEINPSSAAQNPNVALGALNQAQSETARTVPVVQDNVSAIENDQSVSQQSTTGQSAPASGTQSNAPVAPAVDVKQIEQLVERIVSSVRQSQSTGQQLKIRLSPPELGTLQIEVSLKNGEFTAKLEVQNNQVQKVINDNIAQLRDALAKSGIAIDRIEVNINTDSSEDHHSSQSDTRSQSGSEFQSDQFSEDLNDSDQRQDERSSVEESATGDEEAEQAEQDRPQVARSQGVATENVEEIDVQI